MRGESPSSLGRALCRKVHVLGTPGGTLNQSHKREQKYSFNTRSMPQVQVQNGLSIRD